MTPASSPSSAAVSYSAIVRFWLGVTGEFEFPTLGQQKSRPAWYW